MTGPELVPHQRNKLEQWRSAAGSKTNQNVKMKKLNEEFLSCDVRVRSGRMEGFCDCGVIPDLNLDL